MRDGRQVVIKVLHHNIEDKVATDLDIMMALAELGEKYGAELRHYRPHATMMEFRRTLLRELDFRRELRNIQEFIHNFRGGVHRATSGAASSGCVLRSAC